MLNKLRAALACLCLALAPLPAFAQASKGSLSGQVSADFPDNTQGAITPAILRTFLNNQILSFQQYAAINAQNGTAYSVLVGDYGHLVTFNNASPIAVSLPAATTSAGFNPFNFYAKTIGAGTATLTPVSGTINGAASLAIPTGNSYFIIADGTNWQVIAFPAGGGGTVNAGLSGSVAYYATTGPAVSGETLSALLDNSLGSAQGSVIYRDSTFWNVLTPGTSGFFLQTQGPVSNPTWAAASGGTGCNTGGAAGNILTADGAGGCTTDTNTSLTNGALRLGSSGTAGSVALGNATSGTVTVQPVTGALGSVTLSVPAATDTLVARATTDTLSNKTLVAPALGTPISGVATNLTGLPIAGISGLGTGVATALAATLNGSGAISATTSPAFVTPALGTPTAAVLTSATGLPVSTGLTGVGTGVVTGLGTAVGSANGFAGVSTANIFTNTQTFAEVLGTVTTQAGTTYTFAAADCGTEVTFSNAGAVTTTIPVTLPAGCNIAALQLGAGKVSVNGSAVTPATLHSAHTYTGTSAQYAIIGINIEANAGGSAAIAILTGDGS